MGEADEFFVCSDGGTFQRDDLHLVQETARIEVQPQGAKRVARLW